MISCTVTIALLSAAFFVLWQYFESPWLIFGYVLASFTVCVICFINERRKTKRILERFEQILTGKSADHIADEHLTPTERRLITRLCELETREAKVQNGYKSISSLVADIAHQSKTPLSSILMYTEMSENGEIIRTQTEKLAFLMDSLTKLAKCEGGLIAENLSPKENSVKELIRQVIEANYTSVDAKEIEIRCDVPEELTAVFDLRWTAEALGNILDNAVKYSPQKSIVIISVCTYDMFIRIDIADEGCGIPENELCNIWKRFYRGKNAENCSGVGIGLYLTANILSTEGGRVSAKSSPDGSIFTIFLPKT